ncbi:A/G-specific adenine glycosylase [Curvibacter sp. APW13]|uniref:A/G-specific adenine glycosylase n=1 Tax=Curvibacter sp. APW13 TaxID=3077236 RepID=UPI0028DD98E6|nr:A/G-specific adenine glycosylase [Curvibacter sp. APW13]MDT8992459.1 A/G-specific adenine glycosylase [Curvibacter sp. APW13]
MTDFQQFATRLVRWQERHGRNHLPWQGTRDPYRVWLSEIMLQQTQVATVLGYFERFTSRFPDVASLAAGHEDEVMALWSGLGYYSRARNLHRCAQLVVAQHGGQFPHDAQTLATLPGIGRSTAAAIASVCFGERVAILDANVKRVVSRVFAFDGDLVQAASERALWAHAESLLPSAARDMPRYTQGMMDLGATVCSVRSPDCARCPVQTLCAASRDDPTRFPVRTRTLKRTALSLWVVCLRRTDGAVWLQRRPEKGIWARLYCMPVWEDESALASELAPLAAPNTRQLLPAFTHVLTHKDLHIHPLVVSGMRQAPPGWNGDWYGASQWQSLGLPAPIRKLLETLS